MTRRRGGITRREALQRLGVVAGAAVAAPWLASCADSDSDGGGTTPLRPEDLGLETFVVVMMENRSFDHYFGTLSLTEGRMVDGLAAGFSNPRPDGTPVSSFPMDLRCVVDPPHGFDSTRLQINGGANDGFVREHFARVGGSHADEVMGYHDRAQLPFYYALADEFVLCDRWFCSVAGPTFPNRYYLHSAQANGRTNNALPEDPDGLKWPTIYDSLDAAGIEWKYYFTDLPFLLLFASLRAQRMTKFAPIEQFYEDAAAGTLPPVTIVDPGFALNDDHPPHDIRLGQVFVSSVVHALGQGPQWNRSLLALTYDEHGGFFDHVPPPIVEDERAAEGFGQLGVRVPGLIVSPWAKREFVSSTLYEHSSVPAFIEWFFNLAPLTVRDANANIFLDTLDAARVRRNDPRPFPSLPVLSVDPEVPPECGGAAASDLARFADAGGVPPGFDRRRDLERTAAAISRALIRMGAGVARR